MYHLWAKLQSVVARQTLVLNLGFFNLRIVSLIRRILFNLCGCWLCKTCRWMFRCIFQAIMDIIPPSAMEMFITLNICKTFENNKHITNSQKVSADIIIIYHILSPSSSAYIITFYIFLKSLLEMRLQNSQCPGFCINVNTYVHMYSHNTGEISDMYVCTHSGDRLVGRKLVVYSPLYFFSKILKFVFTCFFWVRHLACGIWVPYQGLNSLTTEPPGKSLPFYFNWGAEKPNSSTSPTLFLFQTYISCIL